MMYLEVTGGSNQRVEKIPFNNPKEFRIQCCQKFGIPYDQGILLDRLNQKAISLNDNLSFQDYQKLNLGFIPAQELFKIHKLNMEQKEQEMEKLKQDLNSQITQLTYNSSNEIQQKENTIKQLSIEMENKIKTLNEKIDEEIKKHNLTKEDLSSQIVLIRKQKEKEYNNLIQKYNLDTEQLNQNLQEYQNAYEKLVPEYQQIYQLCQQQAQSLQYQEQQIAQLNNERQNLEDDHDAECKKLKKKSKELDEELSQSMINSDKLTAELETAKKQLKKEKEQNKKLKQSLVEMQNLTQEENNIKIDQYSEENQKLKAKNTEFKEENKRLQDQLAKLQVIEIQLQNKQKQIQDLEIVESNQAKNYQEQINELNNKIKSITEENNTLKIKTKSQDQTQSELSKSNKEKEIQIKNLQQEIAKLQNMLTEFSSKKEQTEHTLIYEKKNNEMHNQKVISLEAQVKREQSNAKQLQAYIDQLQAKENQFQQDISNLKTQIKELEKLKQQVQQKTISDNKYKGLSERLQQIQRVNKYQKGLIPTLHQRLNGLKISEFQNYKKELLNENQQFKVFKVNCDFNKFNEQLLNGQFYNLHHQCLKAQEVGIYQTQYYPIKLSNNDLQEAYLMRPIKLLEGFENSLLNKTFYIKQNKTIDTYYDKEDTATQLTVNNFLCQFYLNQFKQELQSLKINLPFNINIETQYVIQNLENNRFYHAEQIYDQPVILHFRDFLKAFDNSELSKFLFAFSYYTYWKSNEFLMISYLQTSNNIIYDPYVCTIEGICSQVDLGNLEISILKDFIEADLTKGGQYMKAVEKIKK